MVTDAMRDPFVEYLSNPDNNKPFSQEYKKKNAAPPLTANGHAGVEQRLAPRCE